MKLFTKKSTFGTWLTALVACALVATACKREPPPPASDAVEAPAATDTAERDTNGTGKVKQAPATSGEAAGGPTIAKAAPAVQQPPEISRVLIDTGSFNPTAGQTVNIGYHLAAPADVTLKIYGPNQELVRVLLDNAERSEGHHREEWDGKDDAHEVVPNEAYFFVIEAMGGGAKRVYDPLTFSGGELVNPQSFEVRADEGIISYILPKASRVRIRAGVEKGPMLNTIVNWQPRVRGLCTEVWHGKDRQGVREFSRRPEAMVAEMSYALPENSIITIGNRDTVYRDDYLMRGHEKPRKPKTEREPVVPGLLCKHWGSPVHLSRDPEIEVSFPELDGMESTSQPLVVSLSGDSAIVRVNVSDEAELRFLDEQRYEMVLFVEDVRVIEAEQSHIPFNWNWNLTPLAPGRHYLTINLVTVNDHAGTYTIEVDIEKPAATEPSPGEDSAGPEADKA